MALAFDLAEWLHLTPSQVRALVPGEQIILEAFVQHKRELLAGLPRRLEGEEL